MILFQDLSILGISVPDDRFCSLMGEAVNRSNIF
jgi:hypothetical protein